MRIVIFGGAGRVCRSLVSQALGHGHEVRALVPADGVFDVKGDKLDIVRGNVLGADDVRSAVRGCDAVASALDPGRDDAVGLRVEATRGILTAMAEFEVFRIVSASLATTEGGALAFLRRRSPSARRAFEDVERMEDLLVRSDAYWTIVRPARLTEGPLSGLYRVVDGPSVPQGKTVSHADLAAFMLKSLGQGSYVRRTVAIAY